MNFAKFLRTPQPRPQSNFKNGLGSRLRTLFLQDTSWRLLLQFFKFILVLLSSRFPTGAKNPEQKSEYLKNEKSF